MTTTIDQSGDLAEALGSTPGEVAQLLARAEKVLHPHLDNVARRQDWRDQWELESVWSSCYDSDEAKANHAARKAGLLLQQAQVTVLADLAQAANRIAAALEQAPQRRRRWFRCPSR